MNIHDFYKMKLASQKISMVTCYDFWSAKIIAETAIDCVLVGDSVAMVMHGFTNTIQATVAMMVLHIQAVARGAPNKFIIGDIPFLSHRQGLSVAMATIDELMRAGANAVKLEGFAGNIELIAHVVESGVPVMGHIGLTPQSIHQLGGHLVQAKDTDAEQHLLGGALALEQAGVFAIVLECVTASVAQRIAATVAIPVIGIGAGPNVDGQVLVLQDMLGMNKDFKPKFLKTYIDGFTIIQTALNTFDHEVKAKEFPQKEHCYL
jgi:3-methyl-2-oxobutanoate hydroxymethyltransferase